MLLILLHLVIRDFGRAIWLTVGQVYLDYVLFIQEYVCAYPVPPSSNLTPRRLMRKAAKKTRQAGEKRIAARDIRKVTMVRCILLRGCALLMPGTRLRCESSEDERSIRAGDTSYGQKQRHFRFQPRPV